MSDETEFYRAMVLAGNYGYINTELKIKHQSEPGSYLFLDNVGQRGDTLFVFEGKAGKSEKAFLQLRTAYLSLNDPFYKRTSIYGHLFENYSKIRLFYYSFKRGLLIEYNTKIAELQQYKFRDINELSIILRNL